MLLKLLKSSPHLAGFPNSSSQGQLFFIFPSLNLEVLKATPSHSDATRTKETLKSMQAQVDGFMEANVHFIPSFYSIAAMDGQTADHLHHVISKYSSPDITTVMCMGHNKGWEEAASVLSGASVKLKTCNAALLHAFGNSWDDVCITFLASLIMMKEKKKLILYLFVCIINRLSLWLDLVVGNLRVLWLQIAPFVSKRSHSFKLVYFLLLYPL